MKSFELAIKAMRYANPRLDHDFAAELCTRVTQRVADGWVWRWDPILRTRVGLRFPGRQAQYLELLSHIAVPVELLFSERSRFNSEDDAERLTVALSNAHRRDLDGGHNLHLDNPLAIVNAVITVSGRTAG
jgi:pimeloyl-ACP methyl ester carboxylesterase